MGCSGSTFAATQINGAYILCRSAYELETQVDIASLRRAVANGKGSRSINDSYVQTVPLPGKCRLHATPLLGNQSQGATYMTARCTALDCVVMHQMPHAEAARVLLQHGADPFGGPHAMDFHSTPLGRAIKYGNTIVLEVMLASLDISGWARLVQCLTTPSGVTCSGAGVRAGVDVLIHGRRGRTLASNVGNPDTTIRFGDGHEEQVAKSEVCLLPAVPPSVKTLLVKVAEANECGTGILLPIRSLLDARPYAYYGCFDQVEDSSTGL